MPELPDVELYIAKLRERIVGEPLVKLRIWSPFVLRTFSPKPADFEGKCVEGVSRLGKRIVIKLADEYFIVIHLMIAGRFQWKEQAPSGKPAGKIGLATFEFPRGALILTEAGSKKRAAIHLVKGREALAGHDPGGIDPLNASLAEFSVALKRENRTLKRALTSPATFSGIGNAYSDEILHTAKLTPVRLTGQLKDEEIERLHRATQSTLRFWSERLLTEFKDKFPGPGDVTAFRPDFAVHGKYGKPCPVCGKPVQRIQYAENEANYCAVCQNEGRMLADRSLSRLLKSDWPKTLEEWESKGK